MTLTFVFPQLSILLSEPMFCFSGSSTGSISHSFSKSTVSFSSSLCLSLNHLPVLSLYTRMATMIAMATAMTTKAIIANTMPAMAPGGVGGDYN